MKENRPYGWVHSFHLALVTHVANELARLNDPRIRGEAGRVHVVEWQQLGRAGHFRVSLGVSNDLAAMRASRESRLTRGQVISYNSAIRAFGLPPFKFKAHGEIPAACRVLPTKPPGVCA